MWDPRIMNKYMLLAVALFSALFCCGKRLGPLTIVPESGVSIRITDLKYVKLLDGILGFVEIENSTGSFIRVSNQELFLYCDTDSSRAFMKMPGVWEIDKGLINVTAGKTIRYQALWPYTKCNTMYSIQAKYVKVIEREE
jgi:hypothetical protein